MTMPASEAAAATEEAPFYAIKVLPGNDLRLPRRQHAAGLDNAGSPP